MRALYSACGFAFCHFHFIRRQTCANEFKPFSSSKPHSSNFTLSVLDRLKFARNFIIKSLWKHRDSGFDCRLPKGFLPQIKEFEFSRMENFKGKPIDVNHRKIYMNISLHSLSSFHFPSPCSIPTDNYSKSQKLLCKCNDDRVGSKISPAAINGVNLVKLPRMVAERFCMKELF